MKKENEVEDNKKLSSNEESLGDRTKFLLEMGSTAGNQFDKQIVYLSGGGLIFSIGFVKDIIGIDKIPTCKELLFGTWLCFAISLISNLFSYLSTKKATNYALNNNKCKTETQQMITRILNTTSLVFLLIGIILLISFSIVNF